KARIGQSNDSREPLWSRSGFPDVKIGGANMFKSLDIRDHMEVVGSDEKHVGTVDHMEGADRILLTKDDPAAGGKHHRISIDWVQYVDSKIHLNKSCQQAMKEWQTAA